MTVLISYEFLTVKIFESFPSEKYLCSFLHFPSNRNFFRKVFSQSSPANYLLSIEIIISFNFSGKFTKIFQNFSNSYKILRNFYERFKNVKMVE